MTYHLWAEHCDGQSVNHPCRTGVYSDPVEALDMTVEANSEDEAIASGKAELSVILNNQQHCACGRSKLMGNDRWWDSVVVIASRTPYPNYTGDEE